MDGRENFLLSTHGMTGDVGDTFWPACPPVTVGPLHCPGAFEENLCRDNEHGWTQALSLPPSHWLRWCGGSAAPRYGAVLSHQLEMFCLPPRTPP